MERIKNNNINKYLNYLFILYAFIVPLSRAGIVLLSAAIFILWFFTDDFKSKINFIKQDNILKYILLFLLFTIVSLFWSDDISGGIYYIRRYWYLLVIFVIATSLKKEYTEYIISSFLLGMLISEIISYGIFFEIWKFKNVSPMDPSPFMLHLEYSMFLSFTSLLLLNRLFFETQIKWKIFYFIYFLTVTSNLFINGGRTGHLAFALSIFVVGFLNIKNRIKAFSLMLLLVLSIFYMAYEFSSVFKIRVDSSVNESKIINSNKNNKYCGSFGQRLGSWIVAKDIILDNPIIGLGVDNDMDELKKYIAKYHNDKECIKSIANYHNYIVEVFVQLGIIGLFFYFMIFYSILKLDLKNKKYFNLSIIFVSVYTISSMVENMFHQQFGIVLFVLFIGIFIAQKRNESL